MAYSYAHMCRDEHLQIGHNDSEHEMCPLCRANVKIEKLISVLDQGVHVVETLCPDVQRGTNNKVEDFLWAAQSLLDEHDK